MPSRPQDQPVTTNLGESDQTREKAPIKVSRTPCDREIDELLADISFSDFGIDHAAEVLECLGEERSAIDVRGVEHPRKFFDVTAVAEEPVIRSILSPREAFTSENRLSDDQIARAIAFARGEELESRYRLDRNCGPDPESYAGFWVTR